MTDKELQRELEAREQHDRMTAGLRRVSFLADIGIKPKERHDRNRAAG